MSETPETDEINLLLENLDEWIDDSLESSKPIGLTLCSARRTIVDQRARITELWDALGMVSRQRDRMEEELNDAWKERDEARRELKQIEEYGTGEINAAVSLRQELTKARFERDEAMRMLGEQLYQRVDHWTEDFERLLGELNASREEVSALKAKLKEEAK